MPCCDLRDYIVVLAVGQNKKTQRISLKQDNLELVIRVQSVHLVTDGHNVGGDTYIVTPVEKCRDQDLGSKVLTYLGPCRVLYLI